MNKDKINFKRKNATRELESFEKAAIFYDRDNCILEVLFYKKTSIYFLKIKMLRRLKR